MELILGAFAITFLLNRALHWVLSRWIGDYMRSSIVFVVLLILSVVIFTSSAERAGMYDIALILFGLPLLIWLSLDLWRFRKKPV